MSMVLIDDATLQRIADSIKAKRGSDEKMLPSEMPGAIDGISTLENQSPKESTKANAPGVRIIKIIFNPILR